MSEQEKQTITDIMRIFAEGESLPSESESRRLYGSGMRVQEESPSGRCVYEVSNETGTGRIAAWQVFTGIEVYYNELHIGYCNQDQETRKNTIEINHCQEGRFECSFGENSCCYLSAGDLAIGSLMRKKSATCFPTRHYHGITLTIRMDELLPEIRRIMALLNIDLEHIHTYICKENRCCIMRANPSVEHIFAELYHVPEQRSLGYLRVKLLELLLFLSDLNAEKEISQTEYFSRSQVALAKKAAARMEQELSVHHTVQELAEQFSVSPTTLKKCFRGVYGTSPYAYLRTYRLQRARELLIETDFSLSHIAALIGYENPNKFISAFKTAYGITPGMFRRKSDM